MSLAAHFAVRRPEHTTRIDIDAAPGEVIGLIGPNGAGKSTSLRALAGLLPITAGTIASDGIVVSSAETHVPPHQRSIGFVFQDHLLFPHLTAIDNVAFGLRSRRVGKAESRARAVHWLGQLGVDQLGSRRPRELSGGQAQRVAIARALAAGPSMLLLDEPTAALDAAGAMSLRTQLRTHLQEFGGVSIVVTHTALDAMVLTDRIVVLDDGVIVQSGSAADVAARPRTQHVAALMGLNLVRGHADRGVIELPGAGSISSSRGLTGPAFATFSPASVSLYAERPTGSPRNVWEGRVLSLAPHGDAVRVQIEAAAPLLADITPAAMAALELRPGCRVWASVKAIEVTIYAA